MTKGACKCIVGKPSILYMYTLNLKQSRGDGEGERTSPQWLGLYFKRKPTKFQQVCQKIQQFHTLNLSKLFLHKLQPLPWSLINGKRTCTTLGVNVSMIFRFRFKFYILGFNIPTSFLYRLHFSQNPKLLVAI